MTMTKINVFEAKAKLSEYLDRVAAGEQVVICKRNRPVAELRPIVAARTEPRPIGGMEGQIVILPSFFDPLSDEIVDSFYSSEIFPSGVNAAESQTSFSRKKPAGKSRGSAPRRRRS